MVANPLLAKPSRTVKVLASDRKAFAAVKIGKFFCDIPADKSTAAKNYNPFHDKHKTRAAVALFKT